MHRKEPTDGREHALPLPGARCPEHGILARVVITRGRETALEKPVSTRGAAFADQITEMQEP